MSNVDPRAIERAIVERDVKPVPDLKLRSDCGCGPGFQRPKPNGTCATCGGWLPGERPSSLVAMWRGPDCVAPATPTEER